MAAGKRIGALWNPDKTGGKAVMSGTIDLLGLQVRISIYPNDDKQKYPNSSDFNIVSYGLKEQKEGCGERKPAAQQTEFNMPTESIPTESIPTDSLPF